MSEPGSGTGPYNSVRFCDPVGTTTPRGLPAWDPDRSPLLTRFSKTRKNLDLKMKTKIGVIGSAEEARTPELREKATALGKAIASHDVVLLTGATTGLVYLAGKAAHDSGTLLVGVSPAHGQREHIERYGLPTDACDAIIYTGFGLKGRNVVLVRSCDVILIIAGGMGSLNEFTIAYDEGKIIGCLTGTGGVADEVVHLLDVFQKKTKARVLYDDDPVRLIDRCLAKVR